MEVEITSSTINRSAFTINSWSLLKNILYIYTFKLTHVAPLSNVILVYLYFLRSSSLNPELPTPNPCVLESNICYSYILDYSSAYTFAKYIPSNP